VLYAANMRGTQLSSAKRVSAAPEEDPLVVVVGDVNPVERGLFPQRGEALADLDRGVGRRGVGVWVGR
jgi:hypothetical protein